MASTVNYLQKVDTIETTAANFRGPMTTVANGLPTLQSAFGDRMDPGLLKLMGDLNQGIQVVNKAENLFKLGSQFALGFSSGDPMKMFSSATAIIGSLFGGKPKKTQQHYGMNNL